jgi:FixJ family two-component response regulator
LDSALAERCFSERGLDGPRTRRRSDFREIVIVDPPATLTDSVIDRLAQSGFLVTPVADATSCLDLVAARIPAAIIVALSAGERGGLELLRSLAAWHGPCPVIAVAPRADVRTAVHAMRCGATDVVEGPLEAQALLSCLRDACRHAAARPTRPIALSPFPGSELLTRRELEVLSHVASGASNKEAGRLLGISPRTVEVHRARAMEKLGARNAADLVRIILSDAGPHA